MTATTRDAGSRGLMDRERLLRLAPVAAILVVLAILPQVLDRFWVDRITGWIPLAVAAAGLNLLTGYNGQISVGHGALYGLGAYSTAILVNDADLPFLAAIVGGAAICFVAGVVIGLPALRIRGLYLALVTLSVAVLFPDLVRQAGELTGGSSGYYVTTTALNSRGVEVERGVRWEPPEWTGLAEDQWTFYVYLVIAVVCFVLVRNLVNSRTGRAMVAIRDNEVAAEVNGVNVAGVKVATFGLSAALAGVGGGMLALWQAQLFPQSFTLLASFYFLVAVVVGGPASILGPAIGAAFYGLFIDVITPELPERAKSATPLILGIVLILFMRVAPFGVVGSVKLFFGRRALRRAATAAGGPEDPAAVPEDSTTMTESTTEE